MHAWLIFYDTSTGVIDAVSLHELVDEAKLSTNSGLIWVCSSDPDVAGLSEDAIKSTWKVDLGTFKLIAV